MRIISGFLGGRRLLTPPGDVTRPAMARTRESLFSMLEARGLAWQGANVLDLFSGTGSLAFEALSRGAEYAVLVDNSADLAKIVTRNAHDLGLAQRCRAVCGDVIRYLRNPSGILFNIVFVDPPYRRNYAGSVLDLLTRENWLAEGAFVAAEVEKEAEFNVPAALVPDGERFFGQTLVHIWKKQ